MLVVTLSWTTAQGCYRFASSAGFELGFQTFPRSHTLFLKFLFSRTQDGTTWHVSRGEVFSCPVQVIALDATQDKNYCGRNEHLIWSGYVRFLRVKTSGLEAVCMTSLKSRKIYLFWITSWHIPVLIRLRFLSSQRMKNFLQKVELCGVIAWSPEKAHSNLPVFWFVGVFAQFEVTVFPQHNKKKQNPWIFCCNVQPTELLGDPNLQRSFYVFWNLKIEATRFVHFLKLQCKFVPFSQHFTK